MKFTVQSQIQDHNTPEIDCLDPSLLASRCLTSYNVSHVLRLVPKEGRVIVRADLQQGEG